VDVLQTEQLVTVNAKEVAYPVQNYASAARKVTILTTICVWEERPEDSEGDEEC